MATQSIAILDFGSQLTKVIARRIRECNVHSRIYPLGVTAETLRADGVVGVILSGGPDSVKAKGSPHPHPGVFEMGLPVLGICYGVQLMGQMLGGNVASAFANSRAASGLCATSSTHSIAAPKGSSMR